MDYFAAAFGGLSPRNDADAAIKFVLNAILMTDAFESLAKVIPDGSRIGGIGGVPVWKLQRRDAEHSAFAFLSWPANAIFRAYVDPEGFELDHPEYFMDRDAFCRYLTAALRAYLERNPGRALNEHVQAVARMAQHPA